MECFLPRAGIFFQGAGRLILGIANRFPNGTQHSIRVVDHLSIPESQHAIALRFQEMSSFNIIFLLPDVWFSIQLDHQFPSDGAIIHDVLANRVLPAEMDTPYTIAA